jgi:hypothetical protein
MALGLVVTATASGADDTAPAAGSVAVVPAEWQRVNVTADASYCELLRQVAREVLPLFTARNVQFSTTCPAQAVVGSQRLTAEVLAPAESNSQ